MAHQAGDFITRGGKFVVRHDNQHVQNKRIALKASANALFPHCRQCGPGFSVYKCVAIEIDPAHAAEIVRSRQVAAASRA